MLYNRLCTWCKAPFKSNRKDKLTCSKSCSVKSSLKRSKEGLIEDRSLFRTCTCCKIKKPKNEDNFKKYGKTGRFYYYCIPCHQKLKDYKKSDWVKSTWKRIEPKDLQSLANFVEETKRKSYYLDQIDLFKIIHYYDLIKPNNNIPKYYDPFVSFTIMFELVAKFYHLAKKENLI